MDELKTSELRIETFKVESETFKIPIIPMGKPRMTQRDTWKKRPVVLRYHQFKDDLREGWKKAGLTGLPDWGFKLTFILPMPKSWSKRDRARLEGKPCAAKPDIDNLVKAVFDTLKKDDATIWQMNAEKRWGTEGAIHITYYYGETNSDH